MKFTTAISLAAVSFAAATLPAARAGATPRTLPFSYPYETLPEGSVEVEHFIDSTWVRIPRTAAPTETRTTFAPNFEHNTEFEYGVTDHLEIAAYLRWTQDASPEPALRFEGTKYRARYRVAEEGELPVDVAFYLELGIFHDEYELEEKVILSKRFGNLRLMANLWVEQEWERGENGFDRHFIINPTIGATYQLSPNFHLGAEYWARGSLSTNAAAGTVDEFNQQVHHFVGPALSLTFGKFWWSVGAYARVDHLSRSSEIGDAYGKLWVRTGLGVEF
jgi:hypothetical protein